MSIIEISKERIIIKLNYGNENFEKITFDKGDLSSIRIYRTSRPNKPMNITHKPMFIINIKEKTWINIESSNYGFIEHHFDEESKILHLRLIQLKV